MRTQGINRLHGLFLAQGITDVVKRYLATEEVRAETVKELRGLEREEAEHLAACLKLYEGRIQVVRGQTAEDKEIAGLRRCPG